jgi:sulfide:quinone oxidoreductase
MARFLILGGGFGGLAAAHELRGLAGPDDVVTVVARDTHFFMGFAKLWDLAGIRPIEDGTRPLELLGDHGIEFVRADITAIDPARRVVTTSAGELEADALLVALGAGDGPGQIHELHGDAHNLYDPRALPAIRASLAAFHGGRILLGVMGQPFKCPPAPFEAAMLIDEVLRERGDRDAAEIVIATPAPSALPVAGPEADQTVQAALDERGLELRPQHLVTAVDSAARSVTFDNGATLDYTLFLGVPGTVPPPVVRDSPLAGEGGWIRPDPRTLATGFERVYAVGDCTTVPTAVAALPKAGVFAAGEAIVAARNMAADVNGGERARFDGRGFCYLEFPGREVAMVEGDFLAEPKPQVAMSPPSAEGFRHKQEFEAQRLAAWLG